MASDSTTLRTNTDRSRPGTAVKCSGAVRWPCDRCGLDVGDDGVGCDEPGCSTWVHVKCARMHEMSEQQIEADTTIFLCTEHWEECVLCSQQLGTASRQSTRHSATSSNSSSSSSAAYGDHSYLWCEGCHELVHFHCVGIDDVLQLQSPWWCSECAQASRTVCVMGCRRPITKRRQVCAHCVDDYMSASNVASFEVDLQLIGQTCDLCSCTDVEVAIERDHT